MRLRNCIWRDWPKWRVWHVNNVRFMSTIFCALHMPAGAETTWPPFRFVQPVTRGREAFTTTATSGCSSSFGAGQTARSIRGRSRKPTKASGCPMPEWRDIETAPKDGYVDLWSLGERLTDMRRLTINAEDWIDGDGSIFPGRDISHWMPPPDSPYQFECAVCADPFFPRRKDAIYCSDACRVKAYRERKSA